MAEHIDEPELISKEVARRAALKAAEDIMRQRTEHSAPRHGMFALYAWGVLAFVSALFAATATMIPQSETPELVARVNPPPVSTPAQLSELASDADIDQTVTGTIRPEPVETRTVDMSDLPDPVSDREPMPEPVSVQTPATTLQKASVPVAVAEEPSARSSASRSRQFGVDLGATRSVPQLRIRYIAMKRRAPELFHGITPLVLFQEDKQQLIEARLVAGPFDTLASVSKFCRSVRLKLSVDCVQTDYLGASILPRSR